MKRSAWLRPQFLVLLVLLLALVAVSLNHQAVQDWLRLRGYSAPADVSRLSTNDTMTTQARHLFYVNRPTITTGTAFTSHCPAGGEKTVVLGCYVGNDDGIYLYKVTDSRLAGIEEVTAAHEMLHAAYQRLSASERTRVNTMLTNFYEHGLTDQRVKDTIVAYQKSEPHDVVNEMHSVFGTEVSSLPAQLETYYRQYFTDRGKITAYTAQYQAEFTSRENLRKSYDNQLQTLKQQIDANETTLDQQKASLDAQSKQLQTERSSNQVAAYNSGVDNYNAAASRYNALLSATKDLISQYNDIVSKRNAVVLEEQQLTKAISASTLND